MRKLTKIKHYFTLVVCMALLWACQHPEATKDDWPQFKKDNFRSGVADIDLDLQTLDKSWTYQAEHQPEPAWYGPAKEDAYARSGPLPSMRDYDHAYYPIIIGENLYYGSSADDAIHCLDAKTGVEKWQFTTGGPVRIAPTYYQGKLYFGSDDGYVYCIDAQSARLKWKFSAGDAKAQKVLNNGRLISFWPVRTGVIIEDGIAYFGASLLPWKQSYICALDADNGSSNEKGCYVKEVFDMTFEGAMASTGELLIQPQGRIAPSFIKKSNGEKKGQLPGTGGCFVLVTPEKHIVHPKSSRAASISEYVDKETPDYLSFKGGKEMVIKGDTSFIISDHAVSAFNRKTKKTIWVRRSYEAHRILQSGNALYIGSVDTVFALSMVNGLPLWKQKVNGVVQAMAMAQNALYISTNEGSITCFKAGGANNSLFNQNKDKIAVIETIEDEKSTDVLEQNQHLLLGPEIKSISPDSVLLSFQTSQASKYFLNWVMAEGDTLNYTFDKGKKHQVKLVVRKGYKYAYELIDENGKSGTYEYDNFLNFKRAAVDFSKCNSDDTTVSEVLSWLKSTEVNDNGLALVLSDDESDVPLSVAKHSQLDVIVLSDDASDVKDIRKEWQTKAVYSRKLNAQEVENLEKVPVSSHLANLVWVEDASLTVADEVIRLVAPRGMAFVAKADKQWLKAANDLWQVDLEEKPNGLLLIKHPFETEGEWTHQYGRADNSAFGGESLWGSTRAEDFEIQWMGRPGPRFQTDRNGRKPSPLAVNGRMFVQGNQRIAAVNVYNGAILWSKDMPGLRRMNMHRDCSNWAADATSVYLAKADKLIRLDAKTGQMKAYYEVDTKDSDWGYVGLGNDLMIGSKVPHGAAYTDFHGGGGDGWYDSKTGENTHKVLSYELFALSKASGQKRWAYQPQGHVINSTITIEGTTVSFIETVTRKLTSSKRGDDGIFKNISLVRLDMSTGKVLWRHKVIHQSGISMYSMAAGSNKIVVVSSHDWKYMIYTYDGTTGKLLWEKEQPWFHGDHGAHFSRPAIAGNRLVVKPMQYQLDSGEAIEFNVPKSGHGCASYALTEQAIFYRGGSVTQFNFDTREFSRWDRLRPDCWISTIPAQGMVLSPEGGGGCSCGNWLETSMVLAPKSYAPLTINTIQDKPDYKEETYGKYTQKYQPNEFGDSLTIKLLVKPGVKADVYYTLDGSQPDRNSEKYKAPFVITQSSHLRVVMYAGEKHYERTREFTRLRPVPQIERQRTITKGTMEVKFIKAGSTGTVYYTIDGTEPNSHSLNGTSNLIINGKTTVKARTIWVEDGVEYSSDVVTKEVEVPEFIDAVKVDTKPGASYDYYEGSWKKIPDLKTIKAKKSGVVPVFTSEVRKRNDDYGIRYKGYFDIPKNGVYTLYTSTDDGNYLFLHDKMVIDNGGNHGERERSVDIALKKGKHPFTLLYYQGGGGQVLKVSIKGPGMEKQLVPETMLCH
ncbi:MAG: PQQ-binding-like beta-propeller repeat protein [Carboxylicivirga sp.]|jgi:outer membrane protein assembly factor BamB|nr:PQQ-binding-like beta-propeller repeat protein [Carboxylicivirga sp.]